MTQGTALITGGAHRIGAAIARELHAAGLNVAIHYRTSGKAAQQLCDELNAERPDSAEGFAADLLNDDDLPALVQSVADHFGGLSLLVNNASSFYPTPMGEMKARHWDDLFATNARGPLFLSQAAAPLLARHAKGCIVNLVDIHAERPLKGHTIYCMAKAANAMMVQSLARELGPAVRVNGVAPGAILWPERPSSHSVKQTILERTALRRAGEPSDIARAVRFLALEAPYVTGQILAVDGGRTVQQ